MENLERRNAALEMRLNGLTYAQIGEKLGVSRQRAEQMVSPPKEITESVKVKAHGRCENCGIVVAFGHVHHKNTTVLIEDFNDTQNLQYLCPSCHRMAHRKAPEAKVERRTLTCLQCRHQWSPVISLYPWVCPACGSPEWDGDNGPIRRALRRVEDGQEYPCDHILADLGADEAEVEVATSKNGQGN